MVMIMMMMPMREILVGVGRGVGLVAGELALVRRCAGPDAPWRHHGRGNNSPTFRTCHHHRCCHRCHHQRQNILTFTVKVNMFTIELTLGGRPIMFEWYKSRYGLKYKSQITLSHNIGKKIVDSVITPTVELTMDNENIIIESLKNEDNFEINNKDADLVYHHTY